MLIDSELFTALKQAEEGDKTALFEMALNFLAGNKASVDTQKAKVFLLRLVDDEEKDLYEFEYGRLYTVVGHLFYEEKNYKGAHEYFSKAKEFILETYEFDYAEELIGKYELEDLISDTTVN